MPREVFRRPGKNDGRELSVAKSTTQRPELLDPGQYDVRIEEARLVGSSHSSGNISVALRLREVDSRAIVDTRPLWIGGPHADRGPMAARNQRIVSDLLAAAGIDDDSFTTFTDAVLANLVGKVFAVELGIDRGKLAASFNSINRIDGQVVDPDEPAVLPFTSAAAAD
jgi:hypothetical protein